VTDGPPLARRMPGFDGRHATRRAHRTKMVVTTVVVLVVAGVLVFFFKGDVLHHSTPPGHRATHPVTLSKVVSTLVSWRLGAPISGTVVLPGASPAGNQLVILGGATTGGLTASGAFALDVTTGTLTQVGDLSTTLDNASGAVLGGQDVVFGGTASASSSATASVQALSDSATTVTTTPGAAAPMTTSLGDLPQSRADATAVTVGATAYLVGGDGTSGPDPAILSTTDGRHFVTVASLALPVLFPAVAALGNDLYVFGGLADAGPDAGQPVSTIQVVDLKTHKVTHTGHLPEPLSGAAAVVLGHDIVLAGGDTPSPSNGTSSAATTTGPASATSSPTTSTVSTIWSYDPTSQATETVGRLFVAVSHAGVAMLGSTAWLVGGESDGTPVSAVQNLVTAPS
jgi:hypothetical protein